MSTIRIAAVVALVCVHGGILAAGAQARAGGTIAGVVTRAADAQPAAGARIIVAGAGRVTTTDETGSFSLANLPAGTYDVFVQR